ncbi:MAG TPA: hypothetical protein VKX33_02520 [Cyclobacteriaceae bacterium]|nr:hypothetical protein [Cyclobacteriaceae bacterium]
MTELAMYALIFLALIGHTVMAFRMYMAVHSNKSLPLQKRNEWKLKALIFPAFYWPLYKKSI